MENVFTRLGIASTLEKYWGRCGNRCGLMECSGAKSLWRRVLGRQHGIRFDGALYCHPQCLETAMRQELLRVQNQTPSQLPANRMPLGLLMVARGKLTYDQVSAALAAQKKSGTGNIGEWFEKLGFVTEQEVTGALGLQWGCPVSSSLESAAGPHKFPLAILEAFQMWPLQYVSASNTQYVAFGKRVDHATLYAMEKMLDCRVQPCVASGKAIADLIEGLRQESRSGEVEFRSIEGLAEIVRIAVGYIARLNVEEVRMGRIGNFLWLRLKGRATTTNIMFRLQHEAPMTEEAAAFRREAPIDFVPKSAGELWQSGAFSALSAPVS